jgi:hypothetical protein
MCKDWETVARDGRKAGREALGVMRTEVDSRVQDYKDVKSADCKFIEVQ